MPLKFKILLILNILYCTIASIVDDLPGWKMFQEVEKIEYRLQDKNANEVDLYNYVPRDAFLLELNAVISVVEFICRKRADLAPFVFEEKFSSIHRTLKPGHCEISR